MKSTLTIIILIIAISVNAQKFVDTAPKWFDNPPKSTKKFYGIGVGTDKDLYMAERKAKLIANVNIAEQVDSVEVQKTKKVTKLKDGGTSTETTERKVIEASLSEVNVSKKAYLKKGDDYIVYVLLEMKKKK